MRSNYLKIKNTYIRIILIIIFCIGQWACKKDWFDVKADKSQAVPSTLIDMQALMDNVELLNSYSPSLEQIGTDEFFIKDANFKSLPDNERNAYTWSNDFPYIGVEDWYGLNGTGSYLKIFYCNLVLDGLKKITPGNNDLVQWKNVMGQGLFNRARSFYEVAQVFAPAYKLETANQDLGIPLRLESDVNIASKRASIKQTYDQIVNDLIAASELLPVTPQYKTRASKPAAFALLARVCLSMEDYVKAAQYSDSCLKLYSNLLDFSNLDPSASLPIQSFNKEVIFHSHMIVNVITSYMLIDTLLFRSYVDNDLRRSIFFDVNNVSGNVTYKGTYGGIATVLFFTGLATDEVMLIRAECFARSGNAIAAIKLLNDLLSKRWKPGTFTELQPSNAENALKLVLDERKKELLMRGLRWSDLRRLNRDERFKITLKRVIGGQLYTLEPGSYKYTFPIPDDIINVSGIEQNVGWSK